MGSRGKPSPELRSLNESSDPEKRAAAVAEIAAILGAAARELLKENVQRLATTGGDQPPHPHRGRAPNCT